MIDTHFIVSIIMPMDTHKAHQPSDWHPADVKAALEKRGVSLRKLAAACGYSHIQRVLVSPWWAAEQIVAEALGLPAASIWPSRYVMPRTRARKMTRKPAANRIVRAVEKAEKAA